ncbi:unnamed protein product [Victoria cruziana]
MSSFPSKAARLLLPSSSSSSICPILASILFCVFSPPTNHCTGLMQWVAQHEPVQFVLLTSCSGQHCSWLTVARSRIGAEDQ